MVCIYCGYDTEIYNSRAKARQPLVWRRRRCKRCVAQFTTHELPEYATALVVKNGKVLAPFVRDKLFLSIYKACTHRPDAQIIATELTATVIGTLLRNKKARDGSLTVQTLAIQTYTVLKRFDSAVATIYKTYHRTSLK